MANLKQIATQFKSKYNDNPFPSDDINPKDKKGKWCLQWAQAIFSLFINGGTYTAFDEIDRINLLRLYGAGKQPKGLYLDWLLGDINENPQRKGYYNTDWAIFSPAPKFKRIIRGRFEGQDYDYVATAIDPTSSSQREDIMWENYYKSQFGAAEKKIMANVGVSEVPNQVEYIAKSLEELEMFNNIGGFKLKQEIEIENALKYTDYISNMKEIKRKLVDDFVDINKAAFREFFDPMTNQVKWEYMDWANLVVDYSKEQNFKDARFWGYMKFFTINEIRSRRPDLSEYDLQGLATSFAGKWGNPEWGSFSSYTMSGYRNKDGVIVYNQFRVPVFITEWLSNDTRFKMLRTNQRGEQLYYEQDDRSMHNTPKRKTVLVEAANVYTCHWIIGTDYVFEDGLALNAARVDKKIPALSLHAYALPGKSIMESIQPNLDQIQLTWLKLQSALAEAAPNGLKIEVGSLENINLGDGNMKPLELIKLRRQRGDIVYRATTHAGKYNSYANPIENIEGGIGDFLDECVRMFELNFNFISELSGIDRISAASQKPGETTATEVNTSNASTTDALQPLYSGFVYMNEEACNTTAARIQMIVKYNEKAYESYMPVLGKSQLEIMKITKDITPASFGIKVERRPTKEYVAKIIEAATAALQPGRDGEKLTWPDWLLVTRLAQQGNVKQAEAIMTYRLQLSKDEAQKLQQQNMEENRKTMVATEQAKEQREINVMKAKEQEVRLTEVVKKALELKGNDKELENQAKMSVIEHYLPLILGGGEAAPAQPVAQ